MGHLVYGIIIAEDYDSENVPEKLLKFGEVGTLWGDRFLKHIYPEGVPEWIEIGLHYLNGHDEIRDDGQYEIPMVFVKGFNNQDYADSGENPCDVSKCIQTIMDNRDCWDKLFVDFVARCKAKGFNFVETKPHPMMFISWG
jgi:hypothetical protein